MSVKIQTLELPQKHSYTHRAYLLAYDHLASPCGVGSGLGAAGSVVAGSCFSSCPVLDTVLLLSGVVNESNDDMVALDSFSGRFKMKRSCCGESDWSSLDT